MNGVIWLLVLPVLFLSILIARTVRRGLQIRQLIADGVETTGRIVSRTSFRSSRTHTRTRFLRYEYVDGSGRPHSQRCALPADQWANHEEGAPIAIVYSASRPEVSAPQFVVDLGREALSKRSARSG